MKLYLFLGLLTASCLLQAQSVIITEILADPTPSHGLPEREYLEIFNRSDRPVSLSGYVLQYGNTRVTFPAAVIEPGEYAIVCRSAYTPELAPWGKVIGLTNLVLNNSGNTLSLSDPTRTETHTVTYSSAWYTPGRSEGYSLEMIDPDYPCRGKANWASSTAAQGGTPGQPNSVARPNPDETPPELLRYDLEQDRVLLVFNEVMSADLAGNPGHFGILSGGVSVTGAAFGDAGRETVVLSLNRAPDGNLELRIYGAADCTGNTAPDITVTFEDLPEPLLGDIRLSEILFNPLPGGDDFVELHNTKAQHFDLKNWQLARTSADGKITGHAALSRTRLILPGEAYMAFTVNGSFLTRHYPVTGRITEIPALPAYNNDAGTVLLLKPDSTVYDRFTYSEKMHASLVRNPKGVSLERVSFRSRHDLWTSASSDAGFATPGAPNSQEEHDRPTSFFAAEPLVFHPYPNSDTPVTYLTYVLTGGETYASVNILDRHGQPVRSLARSQLLGMQGQITWDGTDDRGGLLPPGYYVFVIRVFGTGLNRTFYAKTVIATN